ncbi:dehydrogenase [Rhodospirillum rubrum]|uniref:molybdopterin oxidoreductase family protein n=1 Tax=Rhodospirillum rubrum TaxID=1085 RepID=UPI001904EBD6|nr:molybdopterin oxidoreductase family protein [Rhodospirillum rubrum]MBK1664062.1 dehydrogenase [Rhodospirillum rubrum]MBK1675462.1 dehydrogenase [Rhodospirillum rubrum]
MGALPSRSVCPHDCASVCPVELELTEDGKLARLRGSRVNSYTEGVICAKVARYDQRLHHPERLMEPLLRVGPKGSGQFRPISWDEALDRTAEGLRAAAAQWGAEAVWPYYYAGTMGLVQRDGINRLRHVLGYSQTEETICIGFSDPGWKAGVGGKRGVDAREMVQSDLVIFWGCNAVHTQVQLMNWATKARRMRGAPLVVVDPYRNATAEKADIHLMPRPGTDGALACAVMHVMFAEGLADRAYMAAHTDDPRALEAHLESRTPAWAAAITGLEAAEIIDFARLYGRTKRSYLRLGYGFTRQRNGSAAMHAVSCLPAVSGAWAHPGGGALYSGSGLFPLDTTLIEGKDVADPTVRKINQISFGRALTGDSEALAGGPPVKALLIQNTNPMVVCPETDRVRAGMAREDLFTVVHEQFMTETAAMADIVLPATMFLEHDDIYKAGGHTYLQVAKAVMPAPGQCRSNHAVICALAERLGARHPGFSLSAWALIEATLAASKLPPAGEILESGGLDGVPADFNDAHFLNGFPNASGRFRFRAEWEGPMAGQMPALPDHLALIEEADARYPFRLVAAPARNFLNSTFSETPGSIGAEGRPQVLIRPDEAAALGILDGALVHLTSRRGEIAIHARLFEGLPKGVVVVESLWPNAAFPGGKGINTLTGADPGPPLGGGAFHDNAVAIRPHDHGKLC